MNFNLKDKYYPYIFTQAQRKNLSIQKYLDNLHGQISEKISNQINFKITIEDKINISKNIISKAIKDFGNQNVSLAWTGGKDSTLILWILKEVLKEMKKPFPQIVFINEGSVFEEILDFRKKISQKWKFKFVEVKNSNVLKQAKNFGDKVFVSKLNQRNKKELQRLNFTKKTFNFNPESMVGNHLMKTVPLNLYFEKTNKKALITGIRWDEQEARSNEKYFSQRGDKYTPAHTRVNPILHFTEKGIWEAIKKYKIPFCSLYKKGYRSLGAKETTKKTVDIPAWEQDLKNTSERQGRNQDKEHIMQKLRDLGYM